MANRLQNDSGSAVLDPITAATAHRPDTARVSTARRLPPIPIASAVAASNAGPLAVCHDWTAWRRGNHMVHRLSDGNSPEHFPPP